jgi:hypothetical protein
LRGVRESLALVQIRYVRVLPAVSSDFTIGSGGSRSPVANGHSGEVMENRISWIVGHCVTS